MAEGSNYTGMDIDPSPGSSFDSCVHPRVDENNAVVLVPTKERLMEMLDKLEGKVEKLRKEACKLEEEKDQLLAALDSVRIMPFSELDGLDREEAATYLERIVDRCLTVEVKVHTIRDPMQEEAMHQVNQFIDALVVEMKMDPEGTRHRCFSYLNACSSQTVHGITDKKFEVTLLGCTLDDQKKVKKRLFGLLKYLDRFNAPREVD